MHHRAFTLLCKKSTIIQSEVTEAMEETKVDITASKVLTEE